MADENRIRSFKNKGKDTEVRNNSFTYLTQLNVLPIFIFSRNYAEGV